MTGPTVAGILFLAVAGASVFVMRNAVLRRWRVEMLTALSLVFMAGVIRSTGDVLCLAAMACTGWLAIKALHQHKYSPLMAISILLILGEFLFVRQILPWPVASTIGLSYVMFRIIHMIVDAQGDELSSDLSWRSYICYLFCFLTFLAGPIQRAQDFTAELEQAEPPPFGAVLAGATAMIVSGYFMFMPVSALFYGCFVWSLSSPQAIPAALAHTVSWLSFAAYLYASFSGYTDIVRGFGCLIGINLPVNFRQPWAAANFLDFWSRWHISLSDWFKLYLFNPLVKALISRNGNPAWIPYLGAVGYFVAFFVMGVWHGVSLRFVFYGLCLGAGVSANKIYQTIMLKRIGRGRYNRLVREPLYVGCARGLAVGFFILALGFLWINDDWSAAWLDAGGLVLLTVSMVSVACSHLGPSPVFPKWLVANPQGKAPFLTAARMVVLIAFVLWDGIAPPLLYAYF